MNLKTTQILIILYRFDTLDHLQRLICLICICWPW